MKLKAIISDIDGTLVPVQATKVSQKVRQALQKLNDKKIPFSLATGRPYSLVENFVQDLGLTTPIIADNGATIIDPLSGKVVAEELIETAQASKLLKLVHSCQTHYHISTVDGNLSELSNITSKTKIKKFVVHQLAPDFADSMVEKINNDFKQIHAVRTSANEGEEFTDIYITSIKASKQHAVLQLSRHIGVKPEEMIGIGDHYNDFPLLMACGFKVAMGNAVNDLKEIADYIAPSVDEDGIADVIEKYLLLEN